MVQEVVMQDSSQNSPVDKKSSKHKNNPTNEKRKKRKNDLAMTTARLERIAKRKQKEANERNERKKKQIQQPVKHSVEKKTESYITQPAIKINFSPSAVKKATEAVITPKDPEYQNILARYFEGEIKNSQFVFKQPLVFKKIILDELSRADSYLINGRSFGSLGEDENKTVKGLVVTNGDDIDVIKSSNNIIAKFKQEGVTDSHLIAYSIIAMVQDRGKEKGTNNANLSHMTIAEINPQVNFECINEKGTGGRKTELKINKGIIYLVCAQTAHLFGEGKISDNKMDMVMGFEIKKSSTDQVEAVPYQNFLYSSIKKDHGFLEKVILMAGVDGSVEIDFDPNHAEQKKAVESFLGNVEKNQETRKILMNEEMKKIDSDLQPMDKKYLTEASASKTLVPTLKINFSPALVQKTIDERLSPGKPEYKAMVSSCFTEDSNGKFVIKEPIESNDIVCGILAELARGESYYINDQSCSELLFEGKGRTYNLKDKENIHKAWAKLLSLFSMEKITDCQQIIYALLALMQSGADKKDSNAAAEGIAGSINLTHIDLPELDSKDKNWMIKPDESRENLKVNNGKIFVERNYKGKLIRLDSNSISTFYSLSPDSDQKLLDGEVVYKYDKEKNLHYRFKGPNDQPISGCILFDKLPEELKQEKLVVDGSTSHKAQRIMQIGLDAINQVPQVSVRHQFEITANGAKVGEQYAVSHIENKEKGMNILKEKNTVSFADIKNYDSVLNSSYVNSVFIDRNHHTISRINKYKNNGKAEKIFTGEEADKVLSELKITDNTITENQKTALFEKIALRTIHNQLLMKIIQLAGSDGSVEIEFDPKNAEQKKTVEEFLDYAMQNPDMQNPEVRKILIGQVCKISSPEKLTPFDQLVINNKTNRQKIAQKILSGKELEPIDKSFVQRIVAPYFTFYENNDFEFNAHKLMSADAATQIMGMYIFSQYSEKWNTDILVRIKPDRQNIGQNKLLFAAFQIELASGKSGPIVEKILNDLLNEPNIFGTIFESETHQANKTARDFIRSMSLKHIDELANVVSKSKIDESKKSILIDKIAELVLTSENFKVVYKPENKKLNNAIVKISEEKPGIFDWLFGRSAYQRQQNAAALGLKKMDDNTLMSITLGVSVQSPDLTATEEFVREQIKLTQQAEQVTEDYEKSKQRSSSADLHSEKTGVLEVATTCAGELDKPFTGLPLPGVTTNQVR